MDDDDDKLDGPYIGGKRVRDMVQQKAHPGTGRLDPIKMPRREVTELFCYDQGKAPRFTDVKEAIGTRWKTPIKEEGEGSRAGQTVEWLRYWDLGAYVDIGSSDQVGIAWRRIIIDG